MSQTLATLLNIPKTSFTRTISQLETGSGQPRIDIQFSTEIKQLLMSAAESLSLDPSDLDAREIFQSAIARLKEDDAKLVISVGLSQGRPASALASVLAEQYQSQMPIIVWAIKKSFLKSILLSNVPKQLQKKLGYRSTASMLKNVPVIELVAAARVYEPQRWQDAYIASLKKIRPSNFELRALEILQLNKQLWVKLDSKRFTKPYMPIVEAGAILSLPVSGVVKPGLGIVTLHYLRNCMNQVKSSAVFLSSQQTSASYGSSVSYVATHGHVPSIVAIASVVVPWQVVLQVAGRRQSIAEVFDSHLSQDDFQPVDIKNIIGANTTGLLWWQRYQQAASVPNPSGPVSINSVDLAHCLLMGQTYKTAKYPTLQTLLWNELLKRYALQPSFTRQIIRQLDNFELAVENDSVSIIKNTSFQQGAL